MVHAELAGAGHLLEGVKRRRWIRMEGTWETTCLKLITV